MSKQKIKTRLLAWEKKYTTDNGKRCSGFGVYPDGRKCKGCSDCNGHQPTRKEIDKIIDRSHTLMATK